jgi:transcription termination factor Rho
MNLSELKKKAVPELLEIAEGMGMENVSRSRKQDLIFSILKRHAKGGEDIWGWCTRNTAGWFRLLALI